MKLTKEERTALTLYIPHIHKTRILRRFDLRRATRTNDTWNYISDECSLCVNYAPCLLRCPYYTMDACKPLMVITSLWYLLIGSEDWRLPFILSEDSVSLQTDYPNLTRHIQEVKRYMYRNLIVWTRVTNVDELKALNAMSCKQYCLINSIRKRRRHATNT